MRLLRAWSHSTWVPLLTTGWYPPACLFLISIGYVIVFLFICMLLQCHWHWRLLCHKATGKKKHNPGWIGWPWCTTSWVEIYSYWWRKSDRRSIIWSWSLPSLRRLDAVDIPGSKQSKHYTSMETPVSSQCHYSASKGSKLELERSPALTTVVWWCRASIWLSCCINHDLSSARHSEQMLLRLHIHKGPLLRPDMVKDCSLHVASCLQRESFKKTLRTTKRMRSAVSLASRGRN
jgi:hypothetical protein